jgi:hypothetical protein
MRRLLLLLTLISAGPALAETIVEHTVTINIQGSGCLREEHLLVRLDEVADLESWQRYPIMLDDDRSLESCRVRILDADRKVVETVPKRKYERYESAGFGLYHSSWLQVAPLPALATGQYIEIDTVIRQTPLYPAAAIALAEDSDQEQLLIEVRGADDSLRHHLRASADDHPYRLTETEQGIRLTAVNVPAWDPPDHSPSWSLASPLLMLSWGGQATWSSVGVWYSDLVSSVAAEDQQVIGRARELCAGAASPRDCVEALAGYVKVKVRYEAVEIGDGGWVPTPAGEVLARGWGDCKDKSLLLSMLLKAAGIPSHLLLIHSGRSGGVDPDFPWPFSFNHCIVAIPAQAAGAGDTDPVAGDLLIIDPTSERGTSSWLTTYCQGRPALLIDGQASRLITTPIRPETEQRDLLVNGQVAPNGDLTGTVQLTLTGSRAVWWIELIRTEPKERVVEDVQSSLSSVIPGLKLGVISWSELESWRPAVRLEADFELAGAIRGQAGRRSLQVHALSALPEPRLLDDRTLPVVLRPGTHTSRWQLQLPADWCPPQARQAEVTDPIGSFTESVSAGDEWALVIERKIVVGQNLFEPEVFDGLKKLAIAESRADKRTVRLRCKEG